MRHQSVLERLPTMEEAEAMRKARPGAVSSLELVLQAVRDVERHGRFLCEDAEARRLAELIVDRLKADQAEMAKPDNSPYLDPDDPGHLDRLRELYDLLGRARPRSVEATIEQLIRTPFNSRA